MPIDFIIFTSLHYLLGIGALAVLAIALLIYTDFLGWFQSRLGSKALSSSKRKAVSMLSHLKNGEFETVQGIWNSDTQKVEDGRVVHSQKVDDTISKTHTEGKVSIFE